MSRITTGGGGGGGGLTEAEADLLYVKIVGDVMTGDLQMGTTAGGAPKILMQGGEGFASGNAGQLQFLGKDPSLIDISAEWLMAWTPTESYMRLQHGDSRFVTDTIFEIYSSAADRGVRVKGDFYPRFDDSFDLGLSGQRWRDLNLSGDISVGDDVTDIGDATNGVRQLTFSDAQTGSNRAAFRGCRLVSAGADIYWGIDDVYPGYYVQKSVVSGSTATDNSEDYSNIYQGDSAYKFISINFDIARTVDGVSNPTNGVRLGDGSFASLGTSLQFFGGGARFFEMYFDQTNNVMRMECGKNNATRTPTLEFRLAGTGPSIRPYLDNSIDFGTSSLMWKDGYFKGDVRQRQAICTGDNAGVASTVSFTNGSDLTTNSTGVGTIKFKGTTSRDSAGFIKIYVGTTAYYVPAFSAITG